MVGCREAATTSPNEQGERLLSSLQGLGEGGELATQRQQVLALDAALAAPAASAERVRAEELRFLLFDALYRRSAESQDRQLALERAASVYDQRTVRPARCAIALRRAALLGEHEGAAAERAALRELRAEIELSASQVCREPTERAQRALGAPLSPEAPSFAVAAPRLAAPQGWFAERAARLVLELRGVRDAEAVELFRGLSMHDDRLSDGTATALLLPGVLLEPGTQLPAPHGLLRELSVRSVARGTELRVQLREAGSRRMEFLLDPPRVVIDLAAASALGGQRARKVRRVVLDAGHGGVDPGAISAAGLQEKDVALDLVRRAALLLRGHGFEVHLTREDDQLIPLAERSAIANALDADLFLSVHCNAAESSASRGVETYILNRDVRQRRDARTTARIAARENGGSEDGAVALGGLLSLTRARSHDAGTAQFAELLQAQAVQHARPLHAAVRDGGVHTAAFAVLVGARMPAVLFEASYVSNAADAQQLAKPDYRQALATGILRAVQAFSDGQGAP